MLRWLAGATGLAIFAVLLTWIRENVGLALMLIGGALAILGLIAHIQDSGRFRSFTLFSVYGLCVVAVAAMFAVSGLGDLLGWWRLHERPPEQGPGRRTSGSEAGRPARVERSTEPLNGG